MGELDHPVRVRVNWKGVRPEDAGSGVMAVPVLGNIAAGEPLNIPPSDSWHAEEVDRIDLPSFLTGAKGDGFALRVKGESKGFYKLAAPVLSRVARRSIRRDLETLKDRLESDAARSSDPHVEIARRGRATVLCVDPLSHT